MAFVSVQRNETCMHTHICLYMSYEVKCIDRLGLHSWVFSVAHVIPAPQTECPASGQVSAHGPRTANKLSATTVPVPKPEIMIRLTTAT